MWVCRLPVHIGPAGRTVFYEKLRQIRDFPMGRQSRRPLQILSERGFSIMARQASHAISYRLTKFETIAGWLYLPFYLLILNLLLQLANVKFSLGMTALTMNLVYFAVNLLAVLLIKNGAQMEIVLALLYIAM